MAVRASVDNCAAGAEMAAANKIAGIETLRNDFNKSILHSCGSSRIHALKPALEPELTRI
jgi:actin-related protein